jgi:hypothetical protein
MPARDFPRRGGERRGRSSWALGVALGALLLGSVPASAVVVHRPVSAFNGSDAPGGPLGPLLVSDAVDQGSGDVYVLESNFGELGKGVVDKFDVSGVYAGVQITGAETPQGAFAFGLASGVAVDDSPGVNRGDVYVADTEHGLVDRFSSAGAYLCQVTGAQTPSASECNGSAGSETPDGSIAPAGVAVDSSGDLYVADDAHSLIDKFGPAGNFIGRIEDPHLSSEMGTIALDSGGSLYVSNFLFFGDSRASDVIKLDAAGKFVAVLDSEESAGVAVDPATNDVYVSGIDEFTRGIAEYASSGARFAFTATPGIAPGMAVDGTTGKIYAAYLSVFGGIEEVSIYSADIVLPTVTTRAASGVQKTSVTFNGHVDPDGTHGGGEVTECEFEYVADEQFQEHPGDRYEGAATASCAPAAPYSAASDVSAGVSGLAPDTTYHFRLDAANADGSSHGEGEAGDEEAVTTSGPPVVDGESSLNAGTTSATVQTQIDPFGFDTSCQVQYVDEAGFLVSGYADAATLPCAPAALGAGFGDRSVSVALGGLRIATTYHYRFLATSQAGTATGADQTFATFGIESFKFQVLNAAGQPDTQAGSHPYELVNSFTLNKTTLDSGHTGTDENLKDIVTELPRGLVANPTATPRCTHSDFTGQRCPATTQVGQLEVLTGAGEGAGIDVGIYNLVPPPDVPAEFASEIANTVQVYIDATVRNGRDYGMTATSANTTMLTSVSAVRFTLWGNPAETLHDSERYCPGPNGYLRGCSSSAAPVAFLTNPSGCGPQSAGLSINSWQGIGDLVNAISVMPAVTGCQRLYFAPSLSVLPDTSAADSPSGVSVDLHVPQNEALEGLATPSLRDVTVELPAGVTLNPAAANGLQACSPAQIGIDNGDPVTCPDASKVGSVEVETPLLHERLEGSVYLAEQNNNPFGSMLALYVTAAADGVLIKVPGRVEADPVTGQLTSTFLRNPELPFSDFKLHFFGGPRAPLATPNACGTYTTTSTLTPWSAPQSGPSPTPFTSFQITSGPGGAPCAPQSFSGGFTAGTTSNQAGGFSPFTLTMSREDGEQNLGTVSTVMPPGIVGMLGKVPLCGEAQANAGTCSAASQIGHVTVGVGAGADPLFVPAPGKPLDPIYLTGPYEGAPFGLSIVVPAEAGPFDLDEGGPVVVRGRVDVDPVTAQVTVTSDPLPQILKGIPLDIRSVNATIDRSEFMVNPTSCERKQIEGKLTSSLGARNQVNVPFQVTNCAALAFKPKLTANTSAKTSRANGASLRVKLTYPTGPYDANIARVKVELPKLLPSRLTTLQKACIAAVFEANPAHCPAASIIGHATATTPVLPVALSGPAYFVSHGGEAFPSLVVVLQGYGLTVQLVGSTFISKQGITSSTFKAVPDVPVGTFELTLPEGPYSALAANGNLCKHKLTMPTEFLAQNGALVKTTTKIARTGCPKAKRHGR